MSNHLLAIAIGPVQEFIAAARRTRDLWFGSYLLSEISKAAAAAVSAGGGELIFPAPASAADLAHDSDLNVANVILAELAAADPWRLADVAKQAARGRWRQFADEVLDEYRALIEPELWSEQADDVVEFFAAWVPLGKEYRDARCEVMRLLGARKLCREFRPAHGREGVPKSSLDGLRESVLKRAKSAHGRRRPLRLRPGEELDAVGLVKRSWAPRNQPPRYPSVSRVAADPWLRRLSESSLAALVVECRGLYERKILHRLDISTERGHAHYSGFPYEGSAVYESRHAEMLEEQELNKGEIRGLIDVLNRTTKEFGEPAPYLAVLVADGDRVGRALSRLESAEDHRSFSQSLAAFAGGVRDIVHEHRGVLVYAGGDDVLAFAPVDQCLRCARALHDMFSNVLAEWSQPDSPLTLSVGVAIAHFLEPLEDLRRFGKLAERHAKDPTADERAAGQQPRDGLAVHLLKRGGGPVEIRSNWADNLDRRLEEWAGHLNTGAVPSRVAGDLHAIARVYDKWPDSDVADVIRRDTLRAISAKQPRTDGAIERVRGLVSQVRDAASLRRLGSELLVARQFATALAQAQKSEVAQEPVA